MLASGVYLATYSNLSLTRPMNWTYNIDNNVMIIA